MLTSLVTRYPHRVLNTNRIRKAKYIANPEELGEMKMVKIEPKIAILMKNPPTKIVSSRVTRP